jgi:hypothetical protein
MTTQRSVVHGFWSSQSGGLSAHGSVTWTVRVLVCSHGLLHLSVPLASRVYVPAVVYRMLKVLSQVGGSVYTLHRFDCVPRATVYTPSLSAMLTVALPTSPTARDIDDGDTDAEQGKFAESM